MFSITKLLNFLGVVKHSEGSIDDELREYSTSADLAPILPPINEVSLAKTTQMLHDDFEKAGQLGIFHSLLNRLQRQPPEHLPTWEDTSEIGELPAWLDSPFLDIIDPYSERQRYSVWVLYYEDGRVQVTQPDPTTGWTNISGDETKWENNSPQPMPKDVVKAICITNGLSTTGRSMPVCNWFLYQK